MNSRIAINLLRFYQNHIDDYYKQGMKECIDYLEKYIGTKEETEVSKAKIIKQGKTPEQLDEERRTTECEECGCVYVYDLNNLTLSNTKHTEPLPWIWGDSLRRAVYSDINHISTCPCCGNQKIVRTLSKQIGEEKL